MGNFHPLKWKLRLISDSMPQILFEGPHITSYCVYQEPPIDTLYFIVWTVYMYTQNITEGWTSKSLWDFCCRTGFFINNRNRILKPTLSYELILGQTDLHKFSVTGIVLNFRFKNKMGRNQPKIVFCHLFWLQSK